MSIALLLAGLRVEGSRGQKPPCPVRRDVILLRRGLDEKRLMSGLFTEALAEGWEQRIKETEKAP